MYTNTPSYVEIVKHLSTISLFFILYYIVHSIQLEKKQKADVSKKEFVESMLLVYGFMYMLWLVFTSARYVRKRMNSGPLSAILKVMEFGCVIFFAFSIWMILELTKQSFTLNAMLSK